jgi:hypothetical protein
MRGCLADAVEKKEQKDLKGGLERAAGARSRGVSDNRDARKESSKL